MARVRVKPSRPFSICSLRLSKSLPTAIAPIGRNERSSRENPVSSPHSTSAFAIDVRPVSGRQGPGRGGHGLAGNEGRMAQGHAHDIDIRRFRDQVGKADGAGQGEAFAPFFHLLPQTFQILADGDRPDRQERKVVARKPGLFPPFHKRLQRIAEGAAEREFRLFTGFHGMGDIGQQLFRGEGKPIFRQQGFDISFLAARQRKDFSGRRMFPLRMAQEQVRAFVIAPRPDVVGAWPQVTVTGQKVIFGHAAGGDLVHVMDQVRGYGVNGDHEIVHVVLAEDGALDEGLQKQDSDKPMARQLRERQCPPRPAVI